MTGEGRGKGKNGENAAPLGPAWDIRQGDASGRKGCHVDHETVTHVRTLHAPERFVDRVDVDDFTLRQDVFTAVSLSDRCPFLTNVMSKLRCCTLVLTP